MSDKSFSENSFMLKYCLDSYKTQEICDQAINNFLQKHENWFLIGLIQKKMIKNHYPVLFADDKILFFG